MLACRVGQEEFACKRLPLFSSLDDLERYEQLLKRYLAELRSRGVRLLETRIERIGTDDFAGAAYCVQPLIKQDAVLSRYLASCPQTEAEALLDQVLESVKSVVSDRVGLDADVSNWCLQHGRLTLIDVTTPMLRDENLKEELQYEMFLTSLPWAARSALKRVGVEAFIGKFYSRRGILLDMLCGLYREGIERHVPYFMARANEVVSESFSLAEVRRYSILNETLWSAGRKLQQLERLWRVRIRRETYPFLLRPSKRVAAK